MEQVLMDANFWSIFGAVVGGLITGGFSIFATKQAFKNQEDHVNKSEEKIIQGLLQAIHDEIETVIDRYQDSMGMRLETLPSNQPLLIYYPLVSDYFSVYHGNTFVIGRVPDNDLRKQIIKTYTTAKGIVDSFRMNNDLVHKFEFSNKLFQETQQAVHEQQAIAHHAVLIEYAEVLKSGHQKLKNEAALLLRMLRKHGVLSEKSV